MNVILQSYNIKRQRRREFGVWTLYLSRIPFTSVTLGLGKQTCVQRMVASTQFTSANGLIAASTVKTIMETARRHNITRKPCCRKETARCHSCSFRFKVRRRHSLQV